MRTMTRSVTVNKAAAAQSVQLIANITSGAAPLTVNFSARTNLSTQVAKYEIDFEGKGSFTDCKTSFENIKHIYTLEKQYNVTLRVTDSNNVQYTDTIAIVVTAKDGLDALLRQKWEGMKAAVLAGNIQQSLDYYHDDTRQKYSDTFTALGGQLASLLSVPERLILLQVNESNAVYEYIVTEDGGDYSYQLSFRQDSNGIWKIFSY